MTEIQKPLTYYETIQVKFQNKLILETTEKLCNKCHNWFQRDIIMFEDEQNFLCDDCLPKVKHLPTDKTYCLLCNKLIESDFIYCYKCYQKVKTPVGVTCKWKSCVERKKFH
jgi:hypothetical protein